ncbi:helix-turn-helix domain-containing protein [Pedobacter metabolipauper]|uniref:Helix-turn-helix protein n=1 Tax=Pedobacter metabolipauper TaxID=425513 RepID=A0A4R6T1H8_9SPHI|nr:helix-turn-helix transcriptional regulator [Pedobacter metabolipauper]TDQ11929.1 helix-turn-helix protein [Pedobacter metabolipauper]
MNTIGKNIRQIRQKNGWNQAHVAKRLSISTPALCKIETGITDINYSRLDQIANLFEISIVNLLFEEGENPQSERQEEVNLLKEKLMQREQEINKLEKKLIELYEEARRK